MDPIHYAASIGDIEEVVRLVQEDGERLNARDHGGMTSLMRAVQNGHDPVVRWLLALRVNVKLTNIGGYIVAHLACSGNRSSTLSLVLGAGAPVNTRALHGWTPLISAARSSYECLKVLLEHGTDEVNLDGQKHDNGSALHIAADRMHVSNVRMLLEAGANPTIRNFIGQMPVDVARARHHQPCTDLLQAAIDEPQSPRLLLKARVLFDAGHAIEATRIVAGQKERLRPSGQREKVTAAASVYLKKRVGTGAPSAARAHEEGR